MTNPPWKAVHEIASSVSVVDAETGKEIKTEPVSWKVMLPPSDHCQICAFKHEPDQPHNAQTLYYRMIFSNQIGREPTWADAMAHCSPEVQAKWKEELTKRGHWSEPPNGEPPVAHHGIENEVD